MFDEMKAKLALDEIIPAPYRLTAMAALAKLEIFATSGGKSRSDLTPIEYDTLRQLGRSENYRDDIAFRRAMETVAWEFMEV